MESETKKKLTSAGAMLACFAVIATTGATALGDKRGSGEHNVSAGVEALAADTATAYETVQFINFRKAGIDEYDMVVVSKAPTEETKSEEEVEKKIESFSMELPADDTKVYDPQPERTSFNATRSVVDEYYTVYDIISGETVTMNAHEMLCRIVYNEIGASWDEDAIKAQTVAAYSYLRFNDSLGLIPTVGLKPGYPTKIENCVNAVEGQCVYYNGNIINAVYSASSVGYSAESENVWGVYYPYLRAVVSAYDENDPNYGLVSEFTEQEVRDIFAEKTDIELSDDVENWFKAESRYSGKYIGKMTVDGHSTCQLGDSDVTITGSTIKKLFGLKSNAFTIDYKDGVFKFTSYGYGHGVGMSQWGACFYAANGYTYDQILKHYYVNTYLGLSDVNQKAVERGEMTKEELEEEIENSQITDDSQLAENTETESDLSNDDTLHTSQPDKAPTDEDDSLADNEASVSDEVTDPVADGSQTTDKNDTEDNSSSADITDAADAVTPPQSGKDDSSSAAE